MSEFITLPRNHGKGKQLVIGIIIAAHVIGRYYSSENKYKKKYNELKTGRFETESLINNTFSSIIDPLNKIRSNIDKPRTHSSPQPFQTP